MKFIYLFFSIEIIFLSFANQPIIGIVSKPWVQYSYWNNSGKSKNGS